MAKFGDKRTKKGREEAEGAAAVGAIFALIGLLFKLIFLPFKLMWWLVKLPFLPFRKR